MLGQSYKNIKAYLKHINTAQGREEIKNAEHQPEWILEVPLAPQPMAATFDIDVFDRRESNSNFQNRMPGYGEIIYTAPYEKSNKMSSDSSEPSSDAFVLYENKARSPKHQMSEVTPLAFSACSANTLAPFIKENVSTVLATPLAPRTQEFEELDYLRASYQRQRA